MGIKMCIRDRPLTITMRTPAETRTERDEEDADLALGFLVGEGLVRSPSEVLAVDTPIGDDSSVVVTLREGCPVSYTHLDVYKRQIWRCLKMLK